MTTKNHVCEDNSTYWINRRFKALSQLSNNQRDADTKWLNDYLLVNGHYPTWYEMTMKAEELLYSCEE
jgi:hypothetical protein